MTESLHEQVQSLHERVRNLHDALEYVLGIIQLIPCNSTGPSP